MRAFGSSTSAGSVVRLCRVVVISGEPPEELNEVEQCADVRPQIKAHLLEPDGVIDERVKLLMGHLGDGGFSAAITTWDAPNLSCSLMGRQQPRVDTEHLGVLEELDSPRPQCIVMWAVCRPTSLADQIGSLLLVESAVCTGLFEQVVDLLGIRQAARNLRLPVSEDTCQNRHCV